MTTQTVNLSRKLQLELAQQGVWAYALFFDSDGNNPTRTSLVTNGAVQDSATVAVGLLSEWSTTKSTSSSGVEVGTIMSSGYWLPEDRGIDLLQSRTGEGFRCQ